MKKVVISLLFVLISSSNLYSSNECGDFCDSSYSDNNLIAACIIGCLHGEEAPQEEPEDTDKKSFENIRITMWCGNEKNNSGYLKFNDLTLKNMFYTRDDGSVIMFLTLIGSLSNSTSFDHNFLYFSVKLYGNDDELIDVGEIIGLSVNRNGEVPIDVKFFSTSIGVEATEVQRVAITYTKGGCRGY